MSVSVETTGSLSRKIHITVPSNEVNPLIDQRIQKLSREASLKGFRRGHVPMKVARQQFQGQVQAEVVNTKINEHLQKALVNESLTPVNTPEVDSIELTEAEGLKFSASFEILPEITVTPFEGQTISVVEYEITDSDVQNTIEKLQREMGTWAEVERASKEGDQINLDITRTIEGSDPQPRKDVFLTLGEESLLPEMTKGLLGKKAGDNFEMSVVYPEDWEEGTVAGETAQFTGQILAVKELTPLSDEAMAEKFNDDDDADKPLVDRIRETMVEESKGFARGQSKETILDKVLELNSFDLPPSMMAQEVTKVKEEHDANRDRGQPVPNFTDEEINEQAEKRLRLGIILGEYIKAKEIKLDEKALRSKIEALASRFPEPETIVNLYYEHAQLKNQLAQEVLLDQVIDAILEEATIETEVKPFSSISG